MIAYRVILNSILFLLFFFNDTATTEIYTLSLHDALPISTWCWGRRTRAAGPTRARRPSTSSWPSPIGRSEGSRPWRSEEHTSELQSRQYLVCRLLLEKKKKKMTNRRQAISAENITHQWTS